MSVDVSRRVVFPFSATSRLLWSCCEAVFSGLLGGFLLVLNYVPVWAISRSGDVSFWVLAVLVFATASFNRNFAHLRVGFLYITEIFLALLLVQAVPGVLRQGASWLPTHPGAKRVVKLLAIYLIYGLVRLMPGVLSGGLLDTLRNFALVYYGLFGLLAWWIFRRRSGMEHMRILLGGMCILATVANTIYAVSFILGMGVEHDPYVKVLSGHAVLFSLFSISIILATLLHNGFNVEERPTFHLLAIAGLLVNGILVFFSGHRSALLALVAAVGVVTVSGRRQLRLNLRWIAVAVLLLCLILRCAPIDSYIRVIAPKYETMSDLSDEPNAAWRLAMWLRLLNVWSSSPVFGVGFAYDLGAQDPWGVMEEGRIDPHNSYVAILARTGIIGLGLVLILVWRAAGLLIGLKRQAARGSDLFLVDSVLGCLVAVAVFASMNVTLETPYHGIFFWLLMGMASALAAGGTGYELRAGLNGSSVGRVLGEPARALRQCPLKRQ